MIDRTARRAPTARRAISVEDAALGQAMRELRMLRAISQEELGFRSGKHRNFIGALERGEGNPTFRTLLAITRGLDVSLSALARRYAAVLRRAVAEHS